MFTSQEEVESYLTGNSGDFSRMGEAVDYYQKHGRNKQLLELLIKHNTGLVNRCLQKYVNYNGPDDAYQDGCEGLLMAVEKYDFLQGWDFSTFALPYIHGYIKKGYHDANPYGLSRRDSMILMKVKKISNQLENEGYSVVNPQKIADAANISMNKYNEISSLLVGSGLLSLDANAKMDDDDSSDFLSMQPDTTNIESDAVKQNTCEIIRDVIKSASSGIGKTAGLDDETTYEIISKKFGLDGNTPIPVKNLSQDYSLTAMQIKILITRLFQKLHTPKYKGILRRKLSVPYNMTQNEIASYVFHEN